MDDPGACLNGESSVANGESSIENGESSIENGKASNVSGESSIENGESSIENGESSIENAKSSIENGKASNVSGESSIENGESSIENGKACNVSGESSNVSRESSNASTDYQSVITEKMRIEEAKLEEKAIREEKNMKEKVLKEQLLKEEREQLEEQCHKRLNLLLSRSSIYAQFMADKLNRDNLKEAKKKSRLEKQKDGPENSDTSKRKNETQNNSPKKRQKSELTVVDVFRTEGAMFEQKESDGNEKCCNSTENKPGDDLALKQPKLLSGAVMHPYQVEGYEWLKVLCENGVNGILADEMGLGKTIQSIALIAFLIEMGVSGPFFVCGPLSTVPNWYSEIKRFAPTIPAIIYHGDRAERTILRGKILKKVQIQKTISCPVIITSYQIALNDAKLLAKYDWKLLVIDEAHRIKNFQCKLVAALKLFKASHRLLLTGTPLQNNLAELWSLLNFILPEIFDDLKVFESWFDITRLTQKGGTDDIVAKEQEKQIVSTIHQILTPFLLRRTKAEVQLKLPEKKEVVVHAPLTKLQQEYYTAALNKTIEEFCGSTRGKHFDIDFDINSGRPKRNITSTNFADIYKMLEDKDFPNDSFDLDDVSGTAEMLEGTKSTLNSIPMSSEVSKDIKPDVNNIPISSEVSKDIKPDVNSIPISSEASKDIKLDVNNVPMSLEVSKDSKHDLESITVSSEHSKDSVDFNDMPMSSEVSKDIPQNLNHIPVTSEVSKAKGDVFAHIKINTRNLSMLLRKVCGHPYLISFPYGDGGDYRIDEDLVKSSGKLLVLDQLLPEFLRRGHKILLFSQFVSMLEILEDYCRYRKYKYNLLCGSMNLAQRDVEIREFNESPDSFMFLISTKAGGLGINLAQADTVIIYDSDWNPQGDLQAQDRCHRIGQTKPVVVYRLVVPNTVDEKILDRATTKRKLEKVIIKKGRFSSKDSGKTYDKLSVEELIELLQQSDFNGFVKTNDNNVLSQSEMERILDRSEMTFM